MQRTLFLLALIVTLPCLAANQVYRWTDSHGISHFSDAPPPHGVPYKLVDLSTGAVSAPPTPSKVGTASSAATPADASKAAQPKPIPDTPANRTALCKRLQKNIALLASDRPLTANSHTSAPMQDDIRRQRLSTDRGQFQKYCSLN